MTKNELIPADHERCQAEFKGGSFMTFGPRPVKRCENKPAAIVTEKKPHDVDGMIGSMSLCKNCLDIMQKVMGKNHAHISNL